MPKAGERDAEPALRAISGGFLRLTGGTKYPESIPNKRFCAPPAGGAASRAICICVMVFALVKLVSLITAI